MSEAMAGTGSPARNLWVAHAAALLFAVQILLAGMACAAMPAADDVRIHFVLCTHDGVIHDQALQDQASGERSPALPHRTDGCASGCLLCGGTLSPPPDGIVWRLPGMVSTAALPLLPLEAISGLKSYSPRQPRAPPLSA